MRSHATNDSRDYIACTNGPSAQAVARLGGSAFGPISTPRTSPERHPIRPRDRIADRHWKGGWRWDLNLIERGGVFGREYAGGSLE